MARTAKLLVVSAAVLGGLLLTGHAAAGGRAARCRLEPPADQAAAAEPRGRVHVRERRASARLDCRLRGLEPGAEHTLRCDALEDGDVAFTADRRGRARLRRLRLEDAAPDRLRVEVTRGDGAVVLERELDRPEPRERHGDASHDHGEAGTPHHDDGHRPHDGTDVPHHGDPTDMPHHGDPTDMPHHGGDVPHR